MIYFCQLLDTVGTMRKMDAESHDYAVHAYVARFVERTLGAVSFVHCVTDVADCNRRIKKDLWRVQVESEKPLLTSARRCTLASARKEIREAECKRP